VVAVVAVNSCIVSEPAEYGVRAQTPPFLAADAASLSPYHTHSLNVGDTLNISVPLRSDDAGEGLFALLILDRNVVGKHTLLSFSEIAPGDLLDTGRSVTVSMSPQVEGCHSLTLMVTHRSNLNSSNGSIDAADTATITWWLNIEDKGTTLLGDCPHL
jgi:hypothetical protein